MQRPTTTADDAQASIAYLFLITLVAAVGGFLFGYDLSLISGAIIFLKSEWQLSPFGVGIVAGSAILGCPFGPLAGMWLADTWGRNRTLIFSSLLFSASALGTALAHGMYDFSFWRFIGGIGVGLASTVSPMYIAEIAPARLRGMLVLVNQLAVVIGLSLSVYVTYLLSFEGHWRLMFATMALPAALLMIGLFFVPQSPRWLVLRSRYDEALAVLTQINGRTQAERELQDIREEIGEEVGGFRELWQLGVRRALVIGVAVMVFSQINGVNMILLYAPTLFMEAGVSDAPDAILNSVYLNTWITLCTVVAFWLTAKCGRRPILIWGSIGMAAGHALMFFRFAYDLPTLVTMAAMFLATASFTLTLAPLSWVILSEIFPNRVRGAAMSISTLAMFSASFITVNVFPIALDWFKTHYGNPGGTFLIFAGICLACALFVWRELPETKDQTLEEIARSWLRGEHES